MSLHVLHGIVGFKLRECEKVDENASERSVACLPRLDAWIATLFMCLTKRDI